MSQNNQLKAYSRLDASGRIIPSTTVLRKKRPVTGRWTENEAYTCCNPFVSISSTPATSTLSTLKFQLSCGASVVATIATTSATTVIQDVVNVLNDKASIFGNFSLSANGLSVVLELDLAVAKDLCADTTTYSFTVTN